MREQYLKTLEYYVSTQSSAQLLSRLETSAENTRTIVGT